VLQGDVPKETVTLAVSLDEARPMIHSGRSIDELEMGVTYNGTGFEVLNRSGTRFVTASVSQSMR
jgi:hypothetical protein